MRVPVAADGDVVAVPLLYAAAANEVVASDDDALCVLQQYADGAVALEMVIANRDAAIDVRRCLRRFGGEHETRCSIAVGCASMLDAVPLNEDVLYRPCFAPT